MPRTNRAAGVRRAFLGVLVASGCLAAPAGAATVEVTKGEVVRYLADPGEANRLTWDDIENSWPTAYVVSDPGASIRALGGCVSLDAHRAVCTASEGSMYHLAVQLGDGDDELAHATFSITDVDGGAGDDRLSGGTWDDRLVGGPGRDQLRGGTGADVLVDGEPSAGVASADVFDGGSGGDAVSYARRVDAVLVDLADPRPDGAPGEGDVITGVQRIVGGRGADRLVGDDVANAIDGGGGRDRMVGGGGDDAFRRAAAGRVSCGGGDDTVTGTSVAALLARDCERVLRGMDDLDAPFTSTVTPRPAGGGLRLAVGCPSYDGSSIRCAATVTVTTPGAPDRVLARGRMGVTSGRRHVDLALTPAGRRRLRDPTRVVVRFGGPLAPVAWQVVLPGMGPAR